MFAKIFPAIVLLAIAVGILAELTFTKTRIYTIAGGPSESDTAVITVKGRVTPKGPNEYVLQDPTGRAELQTCPTWYISINLAPNEEVTVTGEVLKDNTPMPGTLYTIAVHKIVRRNAPVIVLRTRPGKPPWASGKYIPH